MNLDDFFDDISSFEAPVIEPKIDYVCYVLIYSNHAIDFEKNRRVQAISFPVKELIVNKIISQCKEKNKQVGIILENSKAFQIIDLGFIEQYKINFGFNSFNYDTQFCSLKTQIKYHVRVLINKNQAIDCDLAMPNNVGYKHNFYSYYKTHCGLNYV